MSEKYMNSIQVTFVPLRNIYPHSHDFSISFYGTLKDVILKSYFFFWMLHDADVSTERSDLPYKIKNCKKKILAGQA
jgi:hypothetical protein